MPSDPTPNQVTPIEILGSIFTGRDVPPPDEPTAPVDLRQIPREQWERYLCFPILQPPEVAAYVAGMPDTAEAMTVAEKDNLEEAVIAFHGVTEPYTICFVQGVARLMKD